MVDCVPTQALNVAREQENPAKPRGTSPADDHEARKCHSVAEPGSDSSKAKKRRQKDAFPNEEYLPSKCKTSWKHRATQPIEILDGW